MVRSGGALIAWQAAPGTPPDAPYRIVGAHTDSPGFRIKPRPEHRSSGFSQLGVEVYGGPLLNSWLDRDLGLAGRVSVRVDGSSQVRLMRDDRAVLRIPQLAIHLDRDLNDRGLVLDRQRHLVPIWGLDEATGTPGALARYLGRHLDVDAAHVDWWDLAPFDLEPARIGGLDRSLLMSARLDDLVCSHAALAALTSASPVEHHVSVVALFDHEEVGSVSATGAGGDLLAQTLERLSAARGASRDDHLRSLAASHAISADMAHATHPNYPERHEPTHPVVLNGGPVLKVNAQQRYATDARSVGPFLEACTAAGVPVQRFVSNSAIPCGSTIGPISAARLGVPVVDVGIAQLAMHSIREVCGSADPDHFVRVLQHYFQLG